MTTEREALLARVKDIERELAHVRRQLGTPTEQVPQPPFPVLEVDVGEQRYALPLSDVAEVVRVVATETVPDSPAWVLGAFAYRGGRALLVDLRHRLHGTASPMDAGDMMVMTAPGADAHGLLVSAVRDVGVVQPGDLVPPTEESSQATFLVGHIVRDGQRVVQLLSARGLCREFAVHDD